MKIPYITGFLLAVAAGTSPGQNNTTETKIEDALSATIPSIAENATVLDWNGNVLREGSNGWTCLPTPPRTDGEDSRCLDQPWLEWAKARRAGIEPQIDRIGIAYMLRGDEGVSNSDPDAKNPAEVDYWVEAGPHLMLIAPDPSIFDGMPTDPDNGGPWVMWKDTPYAHVMIPVPGNEDESGP